MTPVLKNVICRSIFFGSIDSKRVFKKYLLKQKREIRVKYYHIMSTYISYFKTVVIHVISARRGTGKWHKDCSHVTVMSPRSGQTGFAEMLKSYNYSLQ